MSKTIRRFYRLTQIKGNKSAKSALICGPILICDIVYAIYALAVAMTPNNPSNQREMADFLKGLRELVLTETAAQRKQVHTQWEKPLPSRVAEGFAIENVSLKEIRKDGHVELSCARNISRFREGDILCLSRNTPFAHDSLMVNLVEDEETELMISCETPVEWNKLFAVKDGWTLDVGLIDLSSYITSALAEAGDSDVGRQQICHCLWAS